MKAQEIDKLLEALDHDDIIERYEQLRYYFPRHSERINEWFKENYDMDLDDIDRKG